MGNERLTESGQMPLSEIRRILERGEWWDNVRDVSPDEPCPWLDELNGAIEAALDKLAAYEDAEEQGWLLPVKIVDDERDEPKKPILRNSDKFCCELNVCPTCGHIVEGVQSMENFKFCPGCGQRIDWEGAQ